MIKALQGELRAQPFADMQPSFRDTGETPMLPLARRHAAQGRRGVFTFSKCPNSSRTPKRRPDLYHQPFGAIFRKTR